MTPPLAIDWAQAAQVSATGFTGVFLTLGLLYLCTQFFGMAVRWMEKSDEE